jgi:hypothetical protein
MAIDVSDDSWDTTYEYSSANGSSDEDATWLAHRFDPAVGLIPSESEAWVVHQSPRLSQLWCERGIVGWYTMLWRSPSRRVFVSDAAGAVHVHPDLDKRDAGLWRSDSLDATVLGVWGLDDTCVFAWGIRDKASVMFQWNGKSWKPVPSPGRVVRMSGVSRDAIMAVGTEGLIARWDGNGWRAIPGPTSETLSGIHVVTNDEWYACGQGGSLLEGSSFGIQARSRWPGPLQDVAKFADRVWVASGATGLLRLKGKTNELEVAKANIKAMSFDARVTLLIAASDAIVSTSDGKRFVGAGNEEFVKIRDGEKPSWLEP